MTVRVVKLPARFIVDCIECDCDIGDFENGWLTATAEQFAELRDRAEYYLNPNGPEAPWLKWPAKALLHALERAGL